MRITRIYLVVLERATWEEKVAAVLFKKFEFYLIKYLLSETKHLGQILSQTFYSLRTYLSRTGDAYVRYE